MAFSLNRRRFIETLGVTAAGASSCSWFPQLASAAATDPKRRRSCILLWMGGGPSQTDTFDMKPQHENGGEFKENATSVPGLRFSEHLPGLAKHADQLAVIRSLSTKEGDHGRGTHLMRTGKPPMGAINYPFVGSALGKELAETIDSLPPYVSIGQNTMFGSEAFGPGFLGPKYAPLVVGSAGTSGASLASIVGLENNNSGFAKLQVNSIAPPAGVSKEQMRERLEVWRELEGNFLKNHPAAASHAHRTVYDNTLKMISSDASSAFDLSQEPEALRTAYGKGVFGQGCLLARRLVERQVPFVEVSLNSATSGGVGWDNHSNIFESVKNLSAELDAGWSSLMTDLKDRGLLETTTIVWMGEFGRTPKINGSGGRDHFPQAWSCVLAGGGIAGGQAYGKTSADGLHVEENKVDVSDVLATICSAVGVEPDTENLANTGRPIPIVDGSPISELLS